MLVVPLRRLPESPRRSWVWGQAPPGPLFEDRPVLAVPGRESASEGNPLFLWFDVPFFCESLSPPSSEAISVIREDMILGGPAAERGN